MARRVVLGRVRPFLFRNKRVETTFPSRAGDSTSLVPNRRSYEKLKGVTASRRSGELVPRTSKNPGRVPQEILQEPARSGHRTAPQRSGSESKRRSRAKILVRKVRDSLWRFRETARATNVKLSDLFPDIRMLALAIPVSRTNSNTEHVCPSPGVGRQSIPLPNLSTSFRERSPRCNRSLDDPNFEDGQNTNVAKQLVHNVQRFKKLSI